jgi:isocitrate dehydrogenase kinase/phosphatase
MVMTVFTLPSFPYVFKVIRDWFEPPKDLDRRTVLDKYLMVKLHDRAGRMADTLEYSSVALPLDRFDPALVAELKRVAASSIEIEDEVIVIRHLYIERRMTPLDEYVKTADDERLRAALQEYGDAIADLAGAGIFPGDMLPKNFGVTRYGRVVFYDYDEIAWITDINFRRLPQPSTADEETAGEPWFSVAANDVFPEELPRFMCPPGRARDILAELHAELGDPAFWIAAQERFRAGVQGDLFPYPQSIRFSKRYPEPTR